MARYLTPVRLSILVLIEQYLSGQCGSKARLSVLSFIASHIDAGRKAGGEDDPHALISLDADAIQILAPLTKLASDVPGRSIGDGLVQRLWKINSLDALYELFERLAQITDDSPFVEGVQKQVSRASPLSQYIRRSCVEFTRLQFADTQALWSAIVSWRIPSYDLWAQRNPEAAAEHNEREATAESSVTSQRQHAEPVHGQYMSAEDINDLITTSIYHLQKLGTRVPESMRQKLQSWIGEQRDAGVQSLQHFLAFFEHWRSGQYTMALESLHQYFDYSLIGKATGSGTDNKRIYYQYALLHLSVLHADFNCWNESVDAMDECIATARENQDTSCLNYALSWLLYLRQAKPEARGSTFTSLSGLLGGAGGAPDEINFLKAKARETKNWPLLSNTLLEEAKLDLYTNGSGPKSAELIIQAAFVNAQHDLRTLMPSNSQFEGAVYDRLALSHLAARAHDTVEIVHAGQAPLSDLTRSLCRKAYSVAQGGRCSVALDMLRDALPGLYGVLKLEQKVTGFIKLLQLMRSLRRERLDEAAHHHSQLVALRSLGDPELDFEFNLLEIELFIKQRDLDRAMVVVNAHIRRLKARSSADIAQRLHFLVLKSIIFTMSGHATKGLSVALRAAATASRLRLLPALLEAIAALAHVLNDLSEFDATGRLLEAALPLMIETRQSKLTAQAFVTLGESYVGLAGHACAPDSSEQMQQIRMAEAGIERGRELYERLEDTGGMLECLVMKARLARFRGDEDSAARSEALFTQVLDQRGEQGLSA
ncbi:APC5 protein [Teratosphaeriaceae sp. CCFEE 6253]|nr:APC5 protein [Teratosphaeriaceae sp. CCFEE 6253]